MKSRILAGLCGLASLVGLGAPAMAQVTTVPSDVGLGTVADIQGSVLAQIVLIAPWVAGVSIAIILAMVLLRAFRRFAFSSKNM